MRFWLYMVLFVTLSLCELLNYPLPMIFAEVTIILLHRSFLVTPVPSGGLGLSPSNYAVLVACMFFFSMIWQFQFYPSVSSPRGSLSHLAMYVYSYFTLKAQFNLLFSRVGSDWDYSFTCLFIFSFQN